MRLLPLLLLLILQLPAALPLVQLTMQSAPALLNAQRLLAQTAKNACDANAEICAAVSAFSLEHVVELLLLSSSDARGNFTKETAVSAASSSSSALSSECSTDLHLVLGGLKRMALSMFGRANLTDFDRAAVQPLIDASGKIGPGITRGKTTFMGAYLECVYIDAAVDGRERRFLGSYFRFYLDVQLQPNTAPGACTEMMPSMNGPVPILLGLDLCLPASCASNELEKAVGYGSNHSTPICYVTGVNDALRTPDAPYYIVVIFMFAIIVLCLVAGFVDYFLSPLLKESAIEQTLWWKLFMAFSVYSNIASIFDLSGVNKSGQIGPVHCIRFFSMCWVVMMHYMLFYMIYSSNSLDVIAIIYDTASEALTNAYFSVDSFYFLSGLLLGFIWFKNYFKSRRATMSWQAWLMFYVHRFLRLSPPYFVGVLFTTFVFGVNWMHDMPLIIAALPAEDPCLTSWWTNLLYLNNYIHWDLPCFGQAWYLASEMQMFLFTPLILVPLALAPALGLLVAAAVIFLSTAANVFTIYHFRYPPTPPFFGPIDPEATEIDKYMPYVYTAPYIRCQIYVMGLLVGWLLQYKKRVRFHPLVNLAGWLLSFTLMMFVLLCLHEYTNQHQLPLFWRAAYSALSRPAWGIGLSWIIISCYYGYGGPINDFMSWWVWVPLGRLTYCGFLVHFVLIQYFLGLKKADIVFSNFTDMFITGAIPNIVLTFFISIFWSAFFEISFGRVEMLLLGGLRPTTRPKNPNESERIEQVKAEDTTPWECKDQRF